MNKREAIQVMAKDETVESQSGNLYRLSCSGDFKTRLKNKECWSTASFDAVDCDVTFEIYQEPKKMVKFYQYVTHYGSVTTYFYSDDLIQKYREGVIENCSNEIDEYESSWRKTSNFIEIEV